MPKVGLPVRHEIGCARVIEISSVVGLAPIRQEEGIRPIRCYYTRTFAPRHAAPADVAGERRRDDEQQI